MKRKEFFKKLGLGVGALIIVPQVFAEKPHFLRKTNKIPAYSKVYYTKLENISYLHNPWPTPVVDGKHIFGSVVMDSFGNVLRIVEVKEGAALMASMTKVREFRETDKFLIIGSVLSEYQEVKND